MICAFIHKKVIGLLVRPVSVCSPVVTATPDVTLVYLDCSEHVDDPLTPAPLMRPRHRVQDHQTSLAWAELFLHGSHYRSC